jgi:integrase
VALQAERERRRQLEESWNGIKRRTLPPAFEKAAREWLQGRDGRLAPSTVTIGRVSISHLLSAFSAKLLCDISPQDVAAYQQKRLKDRVQGRTVNIEVQTLRQILKANKFKQLDGEVRPLRERKDVGRALTPDQEIRLLADCQRADSACYTATVLALNSTMRKDEIRKLQWKRVDLFERALTVGKSKTEAGTGRLIPLNNAAVKALADWGDKFPGHKPEHYVFPYYEGTFSPKLADPTRPTNGWRTAWRTVTRAVECPECGKLQRPTHDCGNPECKADIHGLKNPLAGLRFHDLRHTAITKLAEGQASDQTIMSIAGHVSRQMLEHYSHVRIAAKRAALDAIATPLPMVAMEPPQPKSDSLETAGPSCAVHQNGNQNGRLQ